MIEIFQPAAEVDNSVKPETVKSVNIEMWLSQLKPYQDKPSVGELMNDVGDLNAEEAEALKTRRMNIAKELLASMLDTDPHATPEAAKAMRQWWENASVFEINAKAQSFQAELYDLLALTFPGSVEAVILKLNAKLAQELTPSMDKAA